MIEEHEVAFLPEGKRQIGTRETHFVQESNGPAIYQAFSKFEFGKIKKISLSDKVSIAISSLNQSNNRILVFRGECKRAMSWSGNFSSFRSNFPNMNFMNLEDLSDNCSWSGYGTFAPGKIV
jgi:hypothetical protein